MSQSRFFAAILTLSAGALICAAADNNSSRVPVLLELFTSEGCSSCPPADRLLELLDQKQPVPGADLIVLSEHGRFGFVGGDAHEAASAIQEAIRDPKIPIAISNASRDRNQVTAHIEVPGAHQSLIGGRGILYIALADNRVESHVVHGENAGRALTQVSGKCS
jgi:hypothetical protein